MIVEADENLQVLKPQINQGMSHHLEGFKNNSVDGCVLTSLSETDLEEFLGIQSKSERLRILSGIRKELNAISPPELGSVLEEVERNVSTMLAAPCGSGAQVVRSLRQTPLNRNNPLEEEVDDKALLKQTQSVLDSLLASRGLRR